LRREDRVNKKYEAKKSAMLSNRESIVEECVGCKRVDGSFCNAFISPKVKWHLGHCNLATHKVFVEDEIEEKKRAGQQKSKKKSRR
jgi:hypothetical protein